MIIATRLNAILSQYIHIDQTGFIRDRHLCDNVRRIVNLIDHDNQEKVPTAFFWCRKSLWWGGMGFIKCSIEKWGLGGIFLQSIKLLFSNQSAIISVEGFVSAKINICCICQSCPLCLFWLLKIWLLLLESIKWSKGFIPLVYIINWHYMLIMLCFFCVISWYLLTALSSTLNAFSAVSGFRINVQKSIFMGIHVSQGLQMYI